MTSFSFISFAIIAASAPESPSIPQTAFHYDVSLSPIVLLTALILGVVSTTAWGLRRTRKAHIQWPLSLRLIRECAWLLVPLGVLGTFAVLGSPADIMTVMIGAKTDFPSSGARTTSAVAQTLEVPLPTDNRSRLLNSESSTPRPDWIDQPRAVDGDKVTIALASQQYSTREEAEAELRIATGNMVREDLQKIQSGPFRPAHWQPSNEDVESHAVQQRYIEVFERDFGSFFHPMYRVWWQVELSPAVRSEFVPSWRHALIQYRIAAVGILLSILTMLVSSLVMYIRMERLANGSARRTLQVIAGGAMIGWTALMTTVLFGGPTWFAGQLW